MVCMRCIACRDTFEIQDDVDATDLLRLPEPWAFIGDTEPPITPPTLRANLVLNPNISQVRTA